MPASYQNLTNPRIQADFVIRHRRARGGESGEACLLRRCCNSRRLGSAKKFCFQNSNRAVNCIILGLLLNTWSGLPKTALLGIRLMFVLLLL